MIYLSPPVRYMPPEHGEDNFYWHADCRHFQGGLPCVHRRPCPGCPHHDPVDYRVLIVMLGLHGDMLIASPLPARIRREHPGAHITWLTDEPHVPLAAMNPYVDRVLPCDWRAAAHLPAETFDAVYSFEREPAAAALVERVPAAHKAGLAWGGEHSGLYAIGEAAEHFFKMNLWNDYRTILNTKTWTELYFEVAGYRYEGEPYVLEPPAAARARARSLIDPTAGPWVQFNVGSSLETKMWPERHWLTLGAAVLDAGYRLLLTGGPKEAAMCERLHDRLSEYASSPGDVVYESLSLEEFCAIGALCDVVVTGDTFGFHVALAYDRPCVVLFGPSYGAEVIPKHVTTVTSLVSTLPCAPCAHQVTCGGVGGCMDVIAPDAVFHALRAHLDRRVPRPEAMEVPRQP